ncbi:MAG: phosphotransferase-like protein [Candidatus Chromulinivorax sp.]
MKNLVVLCLVGIVFYWVYQKMMYSQKNSSTCGKVIILNGPSAAGKSSLQKSIQKLADEPYLNIGIDNFFNDLFPDEHGKLGQKTQKDFGQDLRWVTIENNLVYLHVGSAGQK